MQFASLPKKWNTYGKVSHVPTPDQTKFCRSCKKCNKISTTFSVTPWSWVSQLLRNFLKFRNSRRSITAFTISRHSYLFRTRLIQYQAFHYISQRCILTVTVHLHIDLPSGLLTSCFPTNILLYHHFVLMRATFFAYLTLLDLISLLILSWENNRRSSSLYSFFFKTPNTSSLFGPNILFSTLFSNALVYVPPLMSPTKFRTHTEPQANQ
jgi:hypothetical protein